MNRFFWFMILGVSENSLHRSKRPTLRSIASRFWERRPAMPPNRSLSPIEWNIQPGTSSFQTHPNKVL